MDLSFPALFQHQAAPEVVVFCFPSSLYLLATENLGLACCGLQMALKDLPWAHFSFVLCKESFSSACQGVAEFGFSEDN